MTQPENHPQPDSSAGSEPADAVKPAAQSSPAPASPADIPSTTEPEAPSIQTPPAAQHQAAQPAPPHHQVPQHPGHQPPGSEYQQPGAQPHGQAPQHGYTPPPPYGAGYQPTPPPAPPGVVPPQAGYPAPGMAGPVGAFPPPPGKGRKGWVVGLSIAAIVLFLCCGCAGVGGYFVYRVVESERNKAKEQVEDYLTAVKEQRFGDAYDMMCRANRKAETESQYAARLQAGPQLKSFDIEGAGFSGNDDVEFEVETRQRFTDGTSRHIYIEVVSQSDKLYACP